MRRIFSRIAGVFFPRRRIGVLKNVRCPYEACAGRRATAHLVHAFLSDESWIVVCPDCGRESTYLSHSAVMQLAKGEPLTGI